MVDGDNVASGRTFDIVDGKGVSRRLNEVALQHWRGERIVKERFVYDDATARREIDP